MTNKPNNLNGPGLLFTNNSYIIDLQKKIETRKNAFIEILFGVKLASRLSDVKDKFPSLEKEIDELAKADPSNNHKYLMWMAQQLAAGANLNDLIPTINFFHKNINRFEDKEINNYTSKSLEDLIKSLGQSKTQKKKEVKQIKPDGKIVLDNQDIFVVRVDNKKAAQEFGQNSKWCITMDNADYYDQYREEGVVFYYIIRKNPAGDEFDKVAWAQYPGEKYELFDLNDDNLGTTLNPEDLNKYFSRVHNIIKTDVKTAPKTILQRLKEGEKVTEEELNSLTKDQWNKISLRPNLSEDFIRKYKDKVDWIYISKYQKLSEDFIREFKDYVDWWNIGKYQKLSEDFIREFKDYVDWFSYFSIKNYLKNSKKNLKIN